MDIGNYIKSLREEKGLSQRKLAELAEISHTEISRIESGERLKPAPSIMDKLAPFLGIPYTDLMKKAGYIEEMIDHEGFTEYVYRDNDGSLADTIRMAKSIQNKDTELLTIMNRVADELTEDEIDIIKNMAKSLLKRKK